MIEIHATLEQSLTETFVILKDRMRLVNRLFFLSLLDFLSTFLYAVFGILSCDVRGTFTNLLISELKFKLGDIVFLSLESKG